ncbi:MAG: hypothetical protein PGN21_04385 [Sphingomonas paucimobilis]
MEAPTRNVTGRVRAAGIASIVTGPAFMTKGLDSSGLPPILPATGSLVPHAPLHAVVATALVIPLVARHFIAWRD